MPNNSFEILVKCICCNKYRKSIISSAERNTLKDKGTYILYCCPFCKAPGITCEYTPIIPID